MSFKSKSLLEKYLLNLMEKAAESKCACKVCWMLRNRLYEITKIQLADRESQLNHYRRTVRHAKKEGIAPENVAEKAKNS